MIPGCDRIRQLVIGGTAVARYVPDRKVGDTDVMISVNDRDKVEEILATCLPRLTDDIRWRTVIPEKLDIFIASSDRFDGFYARGHPEAKLNRTMHLEDLIWFLEKSLYSRHSRRPPRCTEDERTRDAKKREQVEIDLDALKRFHERIRR